MADRRAGAGPSLVELSVALTALVVSVASLFVARHQAQVMDRQLAASVWPLLQSFTSNLDERGQSGVSKLSVLNAGVGPLRIRSFRVSYRGRPMSGPGALFRACCAGGDTLHAPAWVESYTYGRVLRPGEQVDYLTVERDPRVRPDAYDAFERARDQIAVRACYCSVLDDCWVKGEEDPEPVPVKSCAEEQQAPQYR